MKDYLENDEPIFTISAAAKLLNISVHTLRMYENKGLIIPHKKDSGHRLYSKEDLDRIKCIRKLINEDKISINGLILIFSLIPCWDILKCSDKDKKKCKAYLGYSMPCWTYEHPKTICEGSECRLCSVYLESLNCKSIKDKIKKLKQT